ncbi:MAG: ferrous iron transport protein B [Elusimicrobiota bacterium]|jgi:ferrous iron transport protein B|nr:ferrous iron transport protein B [Elusimicrobiota bacterium]
MSQSKVISVALAGNPNCGKSSIFNALTGSNQRVGNYPGVTVEKKTGIKKYKDVEIHFTDLPGTYSLSAYSEDEIVARDFIINDSPDIIVHIIDASNLDRNLYLFTQLRELDKPIIIALNMIDILEVKKQKIDVGKMSDILGFPVIATIGNRGEGINDLLECIVENKWIEHIKEHSPAKVDYGDDIQNEINSIGDLISKDEKLLVYPKNYLAIKLLDNDLAVIEKVKTFASAENSEKILAQANKSRQHLEEHFGEAAENKIAEFRYGFTAAIAKMAIEEIKNSPKKDWTPIIDKYVLNKYLGLPIFAAVMFLIFSFTFTVSTPLVDLLEVFFSALSDGVAAIMPEGPLQSLIIDGLIGGVGGVLSFFPLVLFMFLSIAFFEDSGYMARAAFVMDKLMNKFGLHGKSFLPLMISTNGCAVPGIFASRTLDSKRDRLITMFIAPFMICGAKLPIFALFIGAFFPKNQTLTMFVFYVLSVCIALTAAKVLSKTAFKGDPAHFVMELPPYHIPTLKGILLKMWERGWMYIKKAGTIIVLLTILLWAGFRYPQVDENPDLSAGENASIQMKSSFLGSLSTKISPLVKPIGMDGDKAIALVAGLAAKEVVVSAIGTIYALSEDALEDEEANNTLTEKIVNDSEWSPLKAIVFLIFCMIYPPCITAMAVFFRETGSKLKYLSLLLFGNTALAYLATLLIFQIGKFLRLG